MPYIPGEPGEGDTFTNHSGAARPIGERGGVPDGLKTDIAGRVFSTGPGGCWVWEPTGELLGLIETPELPANVGWGGTDFKTLYLTCRTSVYSLRMKTAGTPVPGMPAASV
jgi:gluconolactonase